MKNRVLVIEPSEVIRRVIAIVLQEDGYEVKALAAFPDEFCWVDPPSEPTVIVVDLGDSLTLNRRALWDVLETSSGSIPIVGLAGPGGMPEGERVHLAAVLAKPFDVDDLLAAVRKAAAS